MVVSVFGVFVGMRVLVIVMGLGVFVSVAGGLGWLLGMVVMVVLCVFVGMWVLVRMCVPMSVAVVVWLAGWPMPLTDQQAQDVGNYHVPVARTVSYPLQAHIRNRAEVIAQGGQQGRAGRGDGFDVQWAADDGDAL
jgi:hypothetical protein